MLILVLLLSARWRRVITEIKNLSDVPPALRTPRQTQSGLWSRAKNAENRRYSSAFLSSKSQSGARNWRGNAGFLQALIETRTQDRKIRVEWCVTQSMARRSHGVFSLFCGNLQGKLER